MAKDKTGPKRPTTAFFAFSSEKRPEIKEAHPDWKVGDIAKELGKLWKEMSDEEKAPYNDIAAKDKERYEREKEEMGVKPTKKAKKAESEDSEDSDE